SPTPSRITAPSTPNDRANTPTPVSLREYGQAAGARPPSHTQGTGRTTPQQTAPPPPPTTYTRPTTTRPTRRDPTRRPDPRTRPTGGTTTTRGGGTGRDSACGPNPTPADAGTSRAHPHSPEGR
ncbi:hypothetical protein PWJ43_40590, partial [Streptomyces sp. BE230]|nr:hypothetical protein [Streptomyces sp. BE230]